MRSIPRYGLLTLALVLLALPSLAGVITARAEDLVSVTLETDVTRTWHATGALSFVVGPWGDTDLYCPSNGEIIEIHEGDTVSVYVDSDTGSIWVDGDEGWLELLGVHIDYLTVNGTTVCAGSDDVELDTQANLDTLTSSITLTIGGSGWTYLSVNGNTVIDSVNDNSSIKIEGLMPLSGGALDLDLDGRYYDGGAATVIVNGVKVPAATVYGMLAIALVGGLVALSARLKPRPLKSLPKASKDPLG
jgi:hypothetical protein